MLYICSVKVRFMKNFILFLSLLFCSCYSDEYLGDDLSLGFNSVYIYDEKLSELDVDSCQVVGALNDEYFINRRCKLIRGNLEIGTRNSFRESEYDVHMRVYVADTLYTSITGRKEISYNIFRDPDISMKGY